MKLLTCLKNTIYVTILIVFRPNSARSHKPYKVLSTEKLAASIKSASYLGRPNSTLTPTTGQLYSSYNYEIIRVCAFK